MISEPENQLLLGVFMPNIAGAHSASLSERSSRPTWEYNRAVAEYAESLGLEFLLFASRYKGMGGELDFQGYMLEPLSACAALAACTTRVKLCATVHTYMYHPATIAKIGASIDQISGGRFGLNVVSGWVQREFRMFNQEPLDEEERGEYATEWLTVVKRLWTEDEVNFSGKYFTINGGYLQPKPVQQPGPTIIKAGWTARGTVELVAREADYQFIQTQGDLAALRDASAQLKAAAARYAREPRVMSYVMVICRDDEAAVEQEVERIIAGADWESIESFAGGSGQMRITGHDALARLALHPGGYEAFGTPKQVAEKIRSYHESGLDGILLQFYDYEKDFHRFGDEVLPLLEQMGLRAQRPAPVMPGFERWGGRRMLAWRE